MNELNIHVRLKEARKYLNLNQLNIANDLNIQQKTVSEIENGKLLNIPNKYMYYFAKKGISLEWMFDGSGLMVKNDSNSSRNKRKTDSLSNKHFEPWENAGESSQKSKGDNNTKPEKITTELIDIVGSKDFSIKSLLSYIKSQENMIVFLQKIISKELNL